ncbi:hypothetical protein KR215_009435, partial [Drosophila sulfurigaster]
IAVALSTFPLAPTTNAMEMTDDVKEFINIARWTDDDDDDDDDDDE